MGASARVPVPIDGGMRGKERENSPAWQAKKDSAPLRKWLAHSLREYSVGIYCMYVLYVCMYVCTSCI